MHLIYERFSRENCLTDKMVVTYNKAIISGIEQNDNGELLCDIDSLFISSCVVALEMKKRQWRVFLFKIAHTILLIDSFSAKWQHNCCLFRMDNVK